MFGNHTRAPRPIDGSRRRPQDAHIRRAFAAILVAGGLVAVFVTASRTPHQSFAAGGWSAYAPPGSSGGTTVPNLAHETRANIGPASCALSWTNLGGIALCTGEGAHSLPPSVIATVRGLLRAQSVGGLLHCLPSMAEPLPARNSYVIPCLSAGTTSASFPIKSSSGGPDAIVVDTFPPKESG